MRILNLGSLNIDRVYSVDHFVQGGETISASKLEFFSGGKGLNQSIALARAGADVSHAGAVGQDGLFLKELLEASGVKTDLLQVLDVPTGHAVIQLTPQGGNCIIIEAGANGCMTEDYIDAALAGYGPGDMLLLQNEVNLVAYAMERAHAHGMRVAFNASPVSAAMAAYPLDLVDVFLVNETEGRVLSGTDAEGYPEVLEALCKRFPAATVVLTAGGDGVFYAEGEKRLSHGVFLGPVVDTTAAGDTFTGFYLASIARGLDAGEALRMASLASSLAISQKGAANSIPTWDDVVSYDERAAQGVAIAVVGRALGYCCGSQEVLGLCAAAVLGACRYVCLSCLGLNRVRIIG